MTVTNSPPAADSPHVRWRSTQERNQKCVDQVLDAASALIATRAIESISMTDIAEEAGVLAYCHHLNDPRSLQIGVARLASRVDESEADVVVNTFAEMVSWTMLRPEPFKEIS